MGGFGWAVRQVSEMFRARPELGVDPVILMGQRRPKNRRAPSAVHGSEIVWMDRHLWRWARQVREARIDLLLSIDYRANYRAFFALLPRTPILLWVRDPWDEGDREIIRQLRIPGQEGLPQGVRPHATQTLAPLERMSRMLGRPLQLAVTTPALAAKIPGSYGVPAEGVAVMPNIIWPREGAPVKAERPVVAFLARLDPYKRPWLAMEVARRFPDVEFVVMGQGHFQGPGSWQPTDVPGNVRLLGHVDEAVKRPELERAWVLLNTSIHEGLAVSFLEALAQETPIVSSVNTEGLAGRFGRAVARYPGDGMDGVGEFAGALRELLERREERERLGREGRTWLEETHSPGAFLEAFFRLARGCGVVTDA